MPCPAVVRSGPGRRGLRRARAAALLTLALPGAVYVYQGEELGLPEVEDLTTEARQDPIFHRTGHADPGRDGCRVPLPWSDTHPSFGFSPAGAPEPWLPQPADWSTLSVTRQLADPDSTLCLCQRALARRAAETGLGDGPMTWLDSADDVLAFARPGAFTCVVNLSRQPVDLPEHDEILLTSDGLDGGRLPADTAAWLRSRSE